MPSLYEDTNVEIVRLDSLFHFHGYILGYYKSRGRIHVPWLHVPYGIEGQRTDFYGECR